MAKIKKSSDTRQRKRGERGPFTHYEQESKPVQPVQKSVEKLLKNWN